VFYAQDFLETLKGKSDTITTTGYIINHPKPIQFKTLFQANKTKIHKGGYSKHWSEA
jgi:hypothetical protein